jgi:hypothetical protein
VQTSPVPADRYEAARRAVRGLAAAVRLGRLYSVGHTLVADAIQSAQQALRAYLDAYGSLDVRATPQGVVFDFSPQACDDEVVADFRRAVDAAGVDGLRVLSDLSASDLEVVVEALALPRAALERAGGLARLLAARGVGTVLALRPPVPPAAPADPVWGVLQALQAHPDQVPASLTAAVGPDPSVADAVLQAVDAAVAAWPAPVRDRAWALVAQAVLALDEPLRAGVCRVVVDRLDEPWAVSLAVRWPSVLAQALVPDQADLSGRLRALHRAPADSPLPQVSALPDTEAARAALQSGVSRTRAAVALVGVVEKLDAARVAEVLTEVEQAAREAAHDGDADAVVRILVELDRLSRRLADGRADHVRQALGRIMSVDLREVLAARSADVLNDPVRRLVTSAPEAIPVLLELLADEERLTVRRSLVAVLAEAAAGHLAVLGEHLSDPRWYVARNVVTALGWTGDPAAVPYLKAAVHHPDLRVRAEALAALAELDTPEARQVLQEATRHPDPQTRDAATRWLRARHGDRDAHPG